AEPGRARAVHDAAAIVGDRHAQTERANRRSANGDAAGFRVAQRIGQRLLRDADDLALHAFAGARELVEDDVDRDVRGALAEVGESLDRRRDVFAGSALAPTPAY